jgi:anti-sigma regulatory factor (Ser/Thr protein kinase)
MRTNAMNCDKARDSDRDQASAPDGPLRFQVRMASNPRLLSVVRNAVSEMAAVSGFDEDQCGCITLAVDEALSNVMRHAYKNRRDGEIEITFEAQADCLEFVFIDRGEPINPSRVCGQPLDEVALGGRGTHLIRQIMDEVCYERVPEGNRLRLKKYFTSKSKA